MNNIHSVSFYATAKALVASNTEALTLGSIQAAFDNKHQGATECARLLIHVDIISKDKISLGRFSCS